MEVLKLWVKVKNQYTYRVPVLEGFLGLSKGIYTCFVQYRGVGESDGLFILSLQNKYIITDKIGSDITLTTNIPQWVDRVGTYSLDLTKAPVSLNTMYKSNSNYMSLGDQMFTIFGSKIAPNDIYHGGSRYSRDGTMLTFYKTRTLIYTGVEFDDNITQLLWDHDNQTFMRTQQEVDDNTDIKELARTAHIARGYFYKVTSLDNWDGWSSDTLNGVYEPFGSTSINKKVGYFKYLDNVGNDYILTQDITESNNVWSVTSKIDSYTYTTNTEPVDLDTTFTNTEHGALVLEFNNYVSLNKATWFISTGVNIK